MPIMPTDRTVSRRRSLPARLSGRPGFGIELNESVVRAHSM